MEDALPNDKAALTEDDSPGPAESSWNQEKPREDHHHAVRSLRRAADSASEQRGLSTSTNDLAGAARTMKAFDHANQEQLRRISDAARFSSADAFKPIIDRANIDIMSSLAAGYQPSPPTRSTMPMNAFSPLT